MNERDMVLYRYWMPTVQRWGYTYDPNVPNCESLHSASELDQLRQRVAELEKGITRRGDDVIVPYFLYQEMLECEESIGAKLALADKWTRAWRNRFIDERMNAYPEACYEMKRCYAESDANDFEAAFDAAIASQGKK